MSKIWTEGLRKRANTAKTLQELGLVGTDVLLRHPVCPLLEVAIGPITTGGFGNAAENLRVYRLAVEALSGMGRNVFNPSAFNPHILRIVGGAHSPRNRTYADDVLEVFCRKVFENRRIRVVCLLPGYRGSIGSCWAKTFFERAGIPILIFPDDLWKNRVLSRL
jgi:hypothetical protein